jgi:hypothetical protein
MLVRMQVFFRVQMLETDNVVAFDDGAAGTR